MKRIIPLFAVLLLGAQLSACSAERQIENQPVSTEAAAEAAATQEPAATPAHNGAMLPIGRNSLRQLHHQAAGMTQRRLRYTG